jgi:hypothetical protein
MVNSGSRSGVLLDILDPAQQSAPTVSVRSARGLRVRSYLESAFTNWTEAGSASVSVSIARRCWSYCMAGIVSKAIHLSHRTTVRTKHKMNQGSLESRDFG